MDNNYLELGFDSYEEMVAYYDLCMGYYEKDIILNKDVCTQIVSMEGWDEYLYLPREDRLKKKLEWKFSSLLDIIKSGDEEMEKEIKDDLDSDLIEYKKEIVINKR